MGIPVTEHVREVHLYVQEHLSEKIAVSEIARECGLNASYLNTCFREQTGESVSAYIRREKVARAETLLLRTNNSLAEICAMLGYFDQSHFSRAFKAVTGMTPGQYRAHPDGKEDALPYLVSAVSDRNTGVGTDVLSGKM